MEYYKNLSLQDLFYIDDDGLVCCEEWKDVVGYEGIYQVSDLGRAKRLLHERFIPINNSFSVYKEKVLKQAVISSKYLAISLCKNNIKETKSIHQLVGKSFLNHNPIDPRAFVIDHINNKQLDNMLKNLQIISHRENSSKDRKGTSKYTGVFYRKDSNKWCSNIGINGLGQIKLGSFINEDDAGTIYKIALRNIDKYNGNNKEFRELINNLI